MHYQRSETGLAKNNGERCVSKKSTEGRPCCINMGPGLGRVYMRGKDISIEVLLVLYVNLARDTNRHPSHGHVRIPVNSMRSLRTFTNCAVIITPLSYPVLTTAFCTGPSSWITFFADTIPSIVSSFLASKISSAKSSASAIFLSKISTDLCSVCCGIVWRDEL